MLTEYLVTLDTSPYLIMALIFLLGWPLEWVPIVLIILLAAPGTARCRQNRPYKSFPGEDFNSGI